MFEIIIDTTIGIWKLGPSGKLFLSMSVLSLLVIIGFFINDLWKSRK